MNFVKKSLEIEGIRGGVEAFKGVGASVRALLLSALDLLAGPWVLGNSFSSPVGSTKVLMQGLREARDYRAIAKV